MIRRSIRLTFGAKAQPGITLQRGDCFSTAICAQCYAPNGCPVSFEGRTVHVVYQTGGQSSPGYEVEARDNVLTWTLPPCAAQTAGPGKMQLMVYGADSLLHSAVIPYTVLDSLEPGEGGEDPVPALVLLLDKAQAAISGANAAAQAAAQVAAEVQSRLDSGAFIGPPGLDAPQIDDTQITTTNPWSSMQIVKTLCPPFSATGSVVQCYPVANYPLGVKVAWEPMQEGEGDPSPENVRPISGRENVSVTRCGVNLLDVGSCTVMPEAYGLSVQMTGDVITVNGTATSIAQGGISFLKILNAPDTSLSGKGYKITAFPIRGSITTIYGLRTGAETSITIGINLVVGQTVDIAMRIMVSEDTPDAYAPYTGTTHTLTLSETIYGGELDAVTGDGVETVHGIVLDGTELWSEDYSESTGLEYFYYTVFDVQWLPSSGGSLALAKLSQKISHFAIGNPYSENVDNAGWVYSTGSADHYGIRIRMSTCADVDEWKSYLAAQAAAGTPLTIAYKLATPTTFQATGSQSLPALSGENVLITNADSLTVTGRADPVQTINALNDRIAAIEDAALNSIGGV